MAIGGVVLVAAMLIMMVMVIVVVTVMVAMTVVMVMVMRMIVAGVAMTVVMVVSMRMIVAAVAMVMAMVLRMIVTGVAMTAIVRGMRGGIGAAFGIERRLDLDDTGAQPFHHVLDDVIATDAQAAARDLRRQMPVAEMPGDPHQMRRIGAPDLQQRLGRRDHFDQPAVFQHQRVAAAKRDGILQVEQEFEAARAGHRHPPAMAVVEVEHDGVGGRFGPPILPPDLRRADHALMVSTLSAVMISITVGAALSGAEYSRQTFMCGARPCALRSSRVSQRSTTT